MSCESPDVQLYLKRVHSIFPYEVLRDINVYGTEKVIALASVGPAVLFHVSTLSVHAAKEAGNEKTEITEDDPLEDFYSLKSGYAQTKWVAEKLVCDAASKGLPTIIFRPGRVTGDSASGSSNLEDFWCKFMKGCIQLRGAPDLDWLVDLNPVDHVAAAMFYIVQERTSLGKTFHMSGKDPTSLSAFFQHISTLGYNCPIEPYLAWRSRLINAAKQGPRSPNEEENTQNALLPLLHLFSEDKTDLERGAKLRFQMANTEAALASAGYRIDLPKDFHEKCLHYLIKKEFLPPPMTDQEFSLFHLDDSHEFT